MREFLLHFFVPQESNNHRAKLLHHTSLVFVVAFFIVGQLFLFSLRRGFPNVLGIATNIVVQDLLSVTNQKRQEAGLPVLRENEQLTQAAALKANDMLLKNYWSHDSPDGTAPWTFIKSSGYTYVYAGENLARGFNTSSEVVEAWMASPAHRDNVVSGNYDEVGFAVVNGTLLGEETTLVVQMFGKKPTQIASSVMSQTSKAQANPTEIPFPTPTQDPLIEKQEPLSVEALVPNAVASSNITPFIDSKTLSKNTALLVLGVFIFALLIDIIIIERKKIVRFVGHSLDHLFYLGTIIILIILLGRGFIL